MRRASGLLLIVVMAAAACGGDGGGSAADPASAGTCEELADIGIAMVQDVVDEVGGMSTADFMEAISSDEPPAAMARMEEQSEALEARADELGCSDTDAQTLMCDRIGRLEADTEVGRLLISSFETACG